MSIPSLATMPSSRLAVAVAAVLILFSSAAVATDPQTSPITLDRVEVRGERPEIATVDSIDQAAKRLGERAGGTAIVDGERYRDGRVSTLADALGYAPGVFIQPRFGAEEARIVDPRFGHAAHLPRPRHRSCCRTAVR